MKYLIYIFILTTSCSQVKKYDSPKELYESENQTFILNQVDTIIQLNYGTKIKFSKNCFDNNDYPIRIDVQEYYKYSDLILKNLQMVTNKKRIIESKGMLHLSVKNFNGEKLVLKKPIKLCPKDENSINKGYTIFYGKFNEKTITWNLNSGIPIAVGDEDEKNLSSFFNVTKLGWINVDKFLRFENKTNFIVNYNGRENINFCLVFKNYNSIISPSSREDKTKLIFNDIPLNEPVSIIATATIGDSFFYNILDVEVSKETVNFYELKEVSKEELKSIIDTKFEPIQ